MVRRVRVVLAMSVAVLLLGVVGCDGGRPAEAGTPSAEPTASTSNTVLETIAYGSWEPDGLQLYTVHADGTDAHALPLPTGDARPELPRWSHGGDRLGLVAATSSGVIGFGWANPDGSQYVQFERPDPTLNLGCVAWSPDDTRIACEGWDDADPSRNGIYTIRTSDGQDLVRVTTAPNGLHDAPGDFSLDGQQIYFNRIDPGGEGRGALMVVRSDGGDEHQLTDLFVGGSRLSPDGTTLLTDDDSHLLLVTVASGESHAIQLETESTVYPFGASWSPDGSHIVFSLGIPNRGYDIYTALADGSDPVQITNTPDVDEEFADWSTP